MTHTTLIYSEGPDDLKPPTAAKTARVYRGARWDPEWVTVELNGSFLAGKAAEVAERLQRIVDAIKEFRRCDAGKYGPPEGHCPKRAVLHREGRDYAWCKEHASDMHDMVPLTTPTVVCDSFPFDKHLMDSHVYVDGQRYQCQNPRSA